MEEFKKPLYVYIKSPKYKEYKIFREQDDELSEIYYTFDSYEELMIYVIYISNLLSLPVQFYM